MRGTIAAVALLLAIFAAELLLSVRQNSQTFDESAHIYSGYSAWKRHDFAVNPEHPPLVKLVAAAPLLPLGLPVQPPPPIYFRAASGFGGGQFLYSHDADALLFRARTAASLFALALALLVFFATREMFGGSAALLALLILILEPVILANGALVTTDVGLSACLFAAIYCFYRYVQRPSPVRLVVCGFATGLTLAAKHSGLIVLPLLAVLAAVEFFFSRTNQPVEVAKQVSTTPRISALKLAGSLVAITAISVTILWSFYGFRYTASPGNPELVPPTGAFLQTLDSTAQYSRGSAMAHHPREARIIGFFERHHLLPEAYLYGLTDVAVLTQQGRIAFVLGKTYPQGRWFYFPAAFVIKTSLLLVLLLLLSFWAKDLRYVQFRRAVLFTAIPALLYFAVAMNSKMQIGIRHILPIYPFLIVLAGVAAWSLARQSRRWTYAVTAILVLGAVSSLRAFPNYLPYSNELWGGVPNTYKYLSDSNVGWSSDLKLLQRYIAGRHITNCWFAYDGPVNPSYYHIGCKQLPTLFSSFIRPDQQQPVPEQIEGPVFLASEVLAGFDFGPGRMNAYEQFRSMRPDAVIAGEVLVFNGTYHVPKAAALSHLVVANTLLRSGQADRAMTEAKAAAGLDADLRFSHELLASLYFKYKQFEQARNEYQAALRVYQTVEPEFQELFGPPENPFPETKTAALTSTGK